MYSDIDKLLSKVDSRFTLSILAAKRARQINEYLSNIRHHAMTDIKGPAFDLINEKPLEIAFAEIAEGKITYERDKEGIK